MALTINITDTILDACHRLRIKRENGKPRGIVVKFTRKVMKEDTVDCIR